MGTCTWTTSDLPEWAGYEIFKAVHEHKAEQVAVYPKAGIFDYTQDTVTYLAGLSETNPIPLHAGSVRYLKEQGIEVPERLIPPEYSGK